MKIDWENKFSYKYNQVPHSGVQHIILDKELKPICNPFFCKEYLQDFIWAEISGTSVNQYGFTYSPLKILDSFYIGIRGDKDTVLNIDNIIGLIKQLEAVLGIKTDMVIEEAEGGLLMSKFGQWLDSPIYSSILLQSLRHTAKFNKKNSVYKNLQEGSFNPNYLLQIDTGWLYKLYLLEQGFYIEQKWKDFKSSHFSHNSGLNTIQFKQLKNKKWK